MILINKINSYRSYLHVFKKLVLRTSFSFSVPISKIIHSVQTFFPPNRSKLVKSARWNHCEEAPLTNPNFLATSWAFFHHSCTAYHLFCPLGTPLVTPWGTFSALYVHCLWKYVDFFCSSEIFFTGYQSKRFCFWQKKSLLQSFQYLQSCNHMIAQMFENRLMNAKQEKLAPNSCICHNLTKFF